MGFNNSVLNRYLLERHDGDVARVAEWLVERMNSANNSTNQNNTQLTEQNNPAS